MLYMTLVPIKGVGDMGALGEQRGKISGSCFWDSGDAIACCEKEGTWGKGSGPEHHFPAKETWTFGSHILETPSFVQEIKRHSGAMETAEQI